ncbi:MAG: metal-dependent transcriptional regulator [Armatimonadota bacterium]|nr:metal-dependent transcriptional regulator [Armatimonadota bacterium]MDR5704149.1 metal-dependent transcriptional regulator [Armatimonadota bacterium]MDR7433656.1 metal-dependent transcriptional regulator [Armatimonadota bacterium]
MTRHDSHYEEGTRAEREGPERASVSKAVEDYLKAIYKLQRAGQVVTTSAIAERLAVAPPSVTNMIKRLARMNLVRHTPYRGVELTPAGEKMALEIIRHHRLLERYLAEALGVPIDQIHDEAERLEHVLSEELEERMDALLGYPATDPHGDPIPTKEGVVATREYQSLLNLTPCQRAVIRRVSDEDPDVLRNLARLGLLPEATIHVLRLEAEEGQIVVEVGDTEHLLPLALASAVYVEPCTA